MDLQVKRTSRGPWAVSISFSRRVFWRQCDVKSCLHSLWGKIVGFIVCGRCNVVKLHMALTDASSI